MTRVVRKLAAVIALGTMLESASAMACLADAGVETPRSHFSLLSGKAASRLLYKGESFGHLGAQLQPALPRTISLTLAQREPQDPSGELKRLGEQESEYGRRKAAALAKKGTGTIVGSASVAAALGLAVLGWNKSEEEDKANVPDDERESGYYLVGAIVVGIGGATWGFSLRWRGQSELRSLEAQKISFGTNSHGHPVVVYSAHF